MAQQICKEGPKMTPGVQKAFGKALKGRKVMQQWWVDDEDPSDSGQVEETERHKAWISIMQEVFDMLPKKTTVQKQKNGHAKSSEPSTGPPPPINEKLTPQDDEGFQLVTRDKRTQPRVRFPGIQKSSGYTWE
ncbi:MAG: hypothetical protein LQ346_008982 [Caloplaca aetnensis]|nr:MAG: hypothetical protein LQ346_008982 [Caloplaca aetnensis]